MKTPHPDSDLEGEFLFSFCHCGSRQKREKVRGNLMEKARLLRFTRNDNFLKRDLGLKKSLDKCPRLWLTGSTESIEEEEWISELSL
jgi:hypothetical protein